MPFSAGTRLGPYEIVSPLGAGGMGEVYRARDTRLGRDVAVKVLPASMAHDPERLARFEQEARATAALNHPNILALYDIGTSAPGLPERLGGVPPIGAVGAPYLVAELLDGETLRDRLGRGALPQRRAIESATQIAAGLAAAHDKGIAHRDLKPENVFVTTDGLNAGTNRDIGFIPIAGGAPTFLANSTANELHAQISPTGRWVAYESDESGVREIYVQRFPAGGGKVRVSPSGGQQPRWRRDGRELYYGVQAAVLDQSAGDGRMMAVPFDDTTDLRLGQPLTLFEGRFLFTGGLGTIANYDVTADGQRFLVATSTGTREEPPITVITNWQSLLER